MALEARTMEHVRAHGYPVPAVEAISGDGSDLVMERVEGPSMATDLGRRPWKVGRQGAALADLHQRLHAIPVPAWLPPAPCGAGDSLIHLDLHPLNVIVARQGLVVIDWPNAARGDAAADVALTWALMAAGSIPSGRARAMLLARGRRFLVDSFLGRFDRSEAAEARARLAEVVAWKVKDPNMTPAEQAALWSLVGKREPGGPPG